MHTEAEAIGMRRNRLIASLASAALAIAAMGTAAAQVEKVAGGLSRTDVGFSIYGAFSGATTGNGVQQSPSNAAGGIVEVRHISNPLIGFEGTYSFNRANQTYNPLVCPATTSLPGCDPVQAISANAHEITGDYVPSVKIANLRPFGLVGAGILFDQPAGSEIDSTSSTKPVFVYGGGLDWGVLPHLGFRLQFRGNLYKAPDLTTLYGSSGAFTHTSEPMIGVYFRL
jgi:opacity protein-like surface antigen